MNDLEAQVIERFHIAAQAMDITPPPRRVIAERAARRSHRRSVLRCTAGVVTVAGLVGGLVLIASRGDAPPAGTSSVTVSQPPIAETGVTLDVTNDVALPDQWSRLPDNDLTARSQHLVVATDTGLLVWGAQNELSAEATPQQPIATDGAYYETTTQTWRALPPAPLATNRSDAVGVWTGSEVVVINGIGSNVKAAAFDPATFTWRTLADPPVDNAANATSQAAIVEGKVFLFSVLEDGAAPQDTAAWLDVEGNNQWVVAPEPPVSLRSGIALVATGANATVVGNSENSSSCNVLHILSYSPTANTWHELPAGPVTNHADPVTAWTGAELFIGGGGTCDNGVANGDPTNQASLLDPTTETWRDASSAPTGFYSSYRYPDIWTGNSVATITPDGSPLLYNPTTDTWHLGPPINGAHPIAPNQTPTAMLQDTIIVSGGGITQDGELCCGPFRGTYAYTIPEGF